MALGVARLNGDAWFEREARLASHPETRFGPLTAIRTGQPRAVATCQLRLTDEAQLT